ncbi:hypothetical protein B0A49_00882 [Cryomyces minteri]|uniref:Major facilitator superfamily (MFS) profile domain-containing protein n=1 Tax=Cryomyces minteri TaxID=331657 RepID=A0A4U0XYA2_9PEZI|nr:hypothetical protein B0A49_00882 [Cryomyces minteri]
MASDGLMDKTYTSDFKVTSPQSPSEEAPSPELGQVKTAHVIDHYDERSLCRKFDYRILPILALMYLCNALDKGNLGNAKTNHLEDNLGFVKGGSQYKPRPSVLPGLASNSQKPSRSEPPEKSPSYQSGGRHNG